MNDRRLELRDWSEIANIIGAITVVVSLLFLALQVKENTAALRSQNQRALIDSLENLEIHQVTDAGLAELLLRAESGGPLEGVDSFRVNSLVFLYLNNWEQALHDHEHGLLEPEIWRALDAWMESKVKAGYFREAARQAIAEDTYSDRFVAHLQEKLEGETGS